MSPNGFSPKARAERDHLSEAGPLAATTVPQPSDAPRTRPEAEAPPTAVWRGLVRIARPRQWVKNLLVFAAPGAAGMLGHESAALHALAAFAIFCLAASGTYFVNDTVDAAADRQHPVKRHRPVAAGQVSASLAVTIGVLLLVDAVGFAWALSGWQLATVIGIYAAVSTAYSLRLKHEPVVDLACVSSGFVLRAIAGGVATGIALSEWFLIVAAFGSLFIVAGKRVAEHNGLGELRAATRRSLSAYPVEFLRSVRLIAAGVTLTAYCLWAFQRVNQGHPHHPIWFELSIAPFVIAVLYVELRFEAGHGDAPEDLALGDHTLHLLGIAWIVLVAIGIYT